MKVIIDRFEGEYAIIEYCDRNTFNMPKKLLPAGAKEGDVIRIDITIDAEKTKQLKYEVEKIADDIWEE